MNKRFLPTLTLALSTTVAMAASTPHAQIGMAVANGSFSLAKIMSTGTATLFDGDLLETNGVSTRVHLKNGVDLQIAAHSGAVIFGDHVQLTSGTLSARLADGYRVDAARYTVRPAGADTNVAVQIADTRVTVAVPAGSAEVDNSVGAVLSKMNAGTTLNFSDAPVAPVAALQQIHLLGVLTRTNDTFLVRDRYTNQINELAGTVPSKQLDQLVAVDGEVISNKSKIPNVDRIVQVTRMVLSDAAAGAPCLADGVGGVAKRVELRGMLSKEQNHFLVTNADHKTYEVVGNVGDSQVGETIHAAALTMPNHNAVSPAQQVVYTEHRNFQFLSSPCAGLVSAGSLVTTGVLLVPKDDSGGPAHTTPISF